MGLLLDMKQKIKAEIESFTINTPENQKIPLDYNNFCGIFYLQSHMEWEAEPAPVSHLFHYKLTLTSKSVQDIIEFSIMFTSF